MPATYSRNQMESRSHGSHFRSELNLPADHSNHSTENPSHENNSNHPLALPSPTPDFSPSPDRPPGRRVLAILSAAFPVSDGSGLWACAPCCEDSAGQRGHGHRWGGQPGGSGRERSGIHRHRNQRRDMEHVHVCPVRSLRSPDHRRSHLPDIYGYGERRSLGARGDGDGRRSYVGRQSNPGRHRPGFPRRWKPEQFARDHYS